MAYDNHLMHLAQARYDEARERRAEEREEGRRALYARCPRLSEISREISGTMGKIIASGLRRGTDPRGAIAALKEENLALQRERAELLRSLGYPEDFLEDRFDCPRCRDTGWLGEAPCSCLLQYYARLQNASLSRTLDFGAQNFETFDFSYYSEQPDPAQGISPLANMERIYDVCRDYANEFSRRKESLLLSGDPGLGKTFLSACIARTVGGNGHSVVYDTAGHVFAAFEAQKFGRGTDEDEAAVNRCLCCDLLVLDDLGTEMTTAFVQSAFYEIVNSRLLGERKTVISTNLSPAAIERQYGAAVASRIRGEYRILPFFGEDIRPIKRRREAAAKKAQS